LHFHQVNFLQLRLRVCRRGVQSARQHPKEEPMANRRSPDTSKRAAPTPAQTATRRPPARTVPSVPAAPRVAVTREARRALIAESAYLRAERRGFAPGHEAEDWLAAEAEVDALLKASHGGSPQ
jgi:hypothetical protein